MQYEFDYLKIVKQIMKHGVDMEASKGKFRQLNGLTLTLHPRTLPILTTRRMYIDGIVGELKGFLNGAETHEELQRYGCNFWGAWTGTPIDYATLLHNFNGVNQLEKVISQLKSHKCSRKAVISLWNPASKTLQPPCVMHYQWIKQGDRLDMIWSQRSADVMIGLASDMISAWLFNQLMAREVGLKAGYVYMQFGSTHIYQEHFDNALKLLETTVGSSVQWDLQFKNIKDWDLTINGYHPNSEIKFLLKV